MTDSYILNPNIQPPNYYYPTPQYDDLEKFRQELHELCVKNHFQYSIDFGGYQYQLTIRCPHDWMTAHMLEPSMAATPGYVQYLINNQLGQCSTHAPYQNGYQQPNAWASYYGQVVIGGGKITKPAYGFTGGGVVGGLAKLFPEIMTYMTWCPECGPSGAAKASISNLIPHINDTHKYTREKIADWLETLPVDLTLKGTKNGKHGTGAKVKKEDAA